MIGKIFHCLKNRRIVLKFVLECLREDADSWYPVMCLGEFYIYTGAAEALKFAPLLEIGTFFYYIYLPHSHYRFFLPLAGKEIIDHLHPGGDFNQRLAELFRFSPQFNLSAEENYAYAQAPIS
jgi:hypothetical protein